MQKGQAERGGAVEKERGGDVNRQVELFYRYLPYERGQSRDQQHNRDTWTKDLWSRGRFTAIEG